MKKRWVEAIFVHGVGILGVDEEHKDLGGLPDKGTKMIIVYEFCFLKLSTANGYLSRVRQAIAKETPQTHTTRQKFLDGLLVPGEPADTINVA